MIESNVYVADEIGAGADTEINGKWVLARPINNMHMFWWERLAVAWKVYKGEYDALKWVDQ